MTLRVALTRPAADAARSAEALQARGFAPEFAPVTEIVATGAEPPGESFDALLATSANAFAFLGAAARQRLNGLTLYVAGERTAAVAREIGLPAAAAIGSDASSLAASLAACLPAASSLLYLAGRDRKSDLESSLRAAGHRVVATEVYAAEAHAWTPAEAEAFRVCGAVLHYSRRSAELAAVAAQGAGLGDHLRAILHVCISTDAAEPLRLRGAKRIVIATGAREIDLLNALSSAVYT